MYWFDCESICFLFSSVEMDKRKYDIRPFLVQPPAKRHCVDSDPSTSSQKEVSVSNASETDLNGHEDKTELNLFQTTNCEDKTTFNSVPSNQSSPSNQPGAKKVYTKAELMELVELLRTNSLEELQKIHNELMIKIDGALLKFDKCVKCEKESGLLYCSKCIREESKAANGESNAFS